VKHVGIGSAPSKSMILTTRANASIQCTNRRQVPAYPDLFGNLGAPRPSGATNLGRNRGLPNKRPPEGGRSLKASVKAIAHALGSKLPLFTELPRRIILGNSVGQGAYEEGRGIENPGGKSGWACPVGGGVIVLLAQPTTVTMTVNNKAVKGCGGLPLLFTENPRRRVLGRWASGVRNSRNRGFRHLAFPETRA
jgi:hypothetical protein